MTPSRVDFSVFFSVCIKGLRVGAHARYCVVMLQLMIICCLDFMTFHVLTEVSSVVHCAAAFSPRLLTCRQLHVHDAKKKALPQRG